MICVRACFEIWLPVSAFLRDARTCTVYCTGIGYMHYTEWQFFPRKLKKKMHHWHLTDCHLKLTWCKVSTRINHPEILFLLKIFLVWEKRNCRVEFYKKLAVSFIWAPCVMKLSQVSLMIYSLRTSGLEWMYILYQTPLSCLPLKGSYDIGNVDKLLPWVCFLSLN